MNQDPKIAGAAAVPAKPISIDAIIEKLLMVSLTFILSLDICMSTCACHNSLLLFSAHI